ncbi:hypothetical protein HZA75_04425 [Candidatus Roizmanbacteria bacterium]|nr:hypothetical protein [Candidatus Roizmanbacteria bacterium]
MNSQTLNKKLMIIAGPCSVDPENINDIFGIAEIKVNNRFGRKQRAVFGTRVIGLKSRTSLNKDGKNMGIDFPVFRNNIDLLVRGQSINALKILPSVRIAKNIIKETGLLVAAEIMDPMSQLPIFERMLPKEKVLIWNPAVSQLGWPILNMSIFAKKNQWFIGLKNPKWFGDENLGQTTMEKTWIGLSHYTGMNEPGLEEKLILIHRGVDIYNKGDYRNLPVHQAAKRTKLATKSKLFFDPSHIHGPKLRDSIVRATVEAMEMKIDEENFLYDGILIEVGRSKTDTEQHITVKELKELCCQLAEFRDLSEPKN